jgi:hypothetical protein
MIDIAAKQLTGDGKCRCTIRITSHGVEVRVDEHADIYGWDQVLRIAFDELRRWTPSRAALGQYGWVVRRRRRGSTRITIATQSETLRFQSDLPVAQWRTTARKIPVAAPAADGKVFIERHLVGEP